MHVPFYLHVIGDTRNEVFICSHALFNLTRSINLMVDQNFSIQNRIGYFYNSEVRRSAFVYHTTYYIYYSNIS